MSGCWAAQPSFSSPESHFSLPSLKATQIISPELRSSQEKLSTQWYGRNHLDMTNSSFSLVLSCFSPANAVPMLTFCLLGQLKNDLTDDNPVLEERLRSLSRLSVADVKPAAEFIVYCLKIDPAKRPSTHDLMKHSWLASGYECSCGYCMR